VRIIIATSRWAEHSIALTRSCLPEVAISCPTVIVPHFEVQERGTIHVGLVTYTGTLTDSEFCCVAFPLTPTVFVIIRCRAVVSFMFILYLVLDLRRLTDVFV
jgi:hypothetical protein